MNTRSKKRTLEAMAAIALVLLIIAGYQLLFVRTNAVYMPYTEFAANLDAGKITEATITEDRVLFLLEGDDTLRSTDQPDYDRFKETLLLSGAKVTDATTRDDVIDWIINGLFDVLFFGVILFGVYKLFTYSRNTFRVVRHTGVRFSDIAGMDLLKRDMMQMVSVLKDREKYRKMGIRPVKGIILEGAPGNGKTLFAKALAEESDVNFIATKGADFQSALMSMGARKIRMLFRRAAKCKPCIVFIDEFDSIGERRNYSGTGVDKENNRIITAMLNEMDGFTGEDGILVIAATNSYQSLDPALIRPGRFDMKFNVGDPDAETRLQLIALYTGKKHLSADTRVDAVVDLFSGLSCAAIETVLNEATTSVTLAGKEEITLNDILAAAGKTAIPLRAR